MTDLLQSAVLSGTGRAAQIGRPVAGKTGTTSSNKDGWFIGFSSGITTGVWMGRDDARTIPGLQGGTAPARAFHDYMVVATANRPVEQFDTTVPLPDWQLEPDEEAMGMPVDVNAVAADVPMVDADGNPLPPGTRGDSSMRSDGCPRRAAAVSLQARRARVSRRSALTAPDRPTRAGSTMSSIAGATANRRRLRASRPAQPLRPTRRMTGATRRNNVRAAATSPSNSAASAALKRGP